MHWRFRFTYNWLIVQYSLFACSPLRLAVFVGRLSVALIVNAQTKKKTTKLLLLYSRRIHVNRTPFRQTAALWSYRVFSANAHPNQHSCFVSVRALNVYRLLVRVTPLRASLRLYGQHNPIDAASAVIFFVALVRFAESSSMTSAIAKCTPACFGKRVLSAVVYR